MSKTNRPAPKLTRGRSSPAASASAESVHARILEAVTVAAFGTLLGLAGGVFGAWSVGALADGAVRQYALAPPWGTLLLICLASLAIGAPAAALPARRAVAPSPLEAVART
ncbi:hypothetical protein [Streptomyces sp. ODS28]|uniref:hypothetical protein n=1 Tax=Streptomyces sp. ODS28 TaxID=3136688 RepID=UPI0031EB9567